MTTPFIFYNLLLSALVIPALPFAGLALLVRPRYRLGLSQRLGFLPADALHNFRSERPLWVHAPSVGEILATRPFLQELKQAFPQTPLLLSVLTPTAYTTAYEKIPEADAVIYCPLDHPLIVSRVVQQVHPAMFFFTETEIWPNLLLTFARRGIPAFLVSGRFSARALARYRWASPLFRPVFQSITRCCMQTNADAQRLIDAGATPERVCVTGNFKVDGVHESNATGMTILAEAGLVGRPLLIGASTHPGEEIFLLRMAQRLRTDIPNLLLLLAPRHPQRFSEVEHLLQQHGCAYIKRSQPTATDSRPTEVFLLDTLGELASFYRAAAVTFVGGSLIKGPGGHSVVEPALARTPVCCGPYTWNFSTLVEQLVQAGGGVVIRTEDDGSQQLLPFFTDSRHAQEAGQRAYEVIKQQQGAVQRTMEAILADLPQMQAFSDDAV